MIAILNTYIQFIWFVKLQSYFSNTISTTMVQQLRQLNQSLLLFLACSLQEKLLLENQNCALHNIEKQIKASKKE